MSGAVSQAVKPPRRVRHGVRDGAVLMAFSLGTSVVLGLLLSLLAGLGS